MTGIGEKALAQPVKPPLRERRACLAKLVKNRLTLTSAIRDCFDSSVVAWRAGERPDAALANSTLEDACALLAPGERPVIHSDRGGHYRWPG